MRSRRCLLHTLLAAALLSLGAPVLMDAALAQGYPSRPIRLIVAYPPGGGSDTLARIVAPRLTEMLAQQVIVDNRAGAAGNIATEIAARAQPDGYTLLWGFSTPLVVNPSLYKNLAFDTDRDFAPILLLGSAQFLLVVHRSVQANSVQELIALLKSKPGELPYGSAGTGSPNHLAAELFKGRAGVDMIHVPTMQELGFAGFDVQAWYGVLAPAGTPKAIVTRLNRDLLKILAMREVQESLKREGLEPAGTIPEEFAAHIKAEKALWAKVIKNAGIRAE